MLACVFLSVFFAFPAAAEENETVYTTKSGAYTEVGFWYDSGSLRGYTGELSRVGESGEGRLAKWNVTVKESGTYRVSFYNIRHEGNAENIVADVAAGEKCETLTFSHRGSFSESRTEILGIYDLSAEDLISVTFSGSGKSGNLRTDSLIVEFFPYSSEMVFEEDGFFEMKGAWYTSSLLGYNETKSKYATGESDGYWSINMRNSGVLDLYIYNLTHSTNKEKISVTFSDSEGEKHSMEIGHDENTQSGLVYLGRFYYGATGREYVEVSADGEGFMRINSLVARLCSKSAETDQKNDYAKRSLTKKNVKIFEPHEDALKIYVGKNSSEGDGSRENPYNSPERAQKAVREIIKNGYPKEGVLVTLLGGTYVTDTLKFTEEDSGTEEAPVLWQAEGEVVLTTAEKLSADSFSVVRDPEILKRLPGSVRGRVYSADISHLEPKTMSISSPYVVSFDDTPGELAHWPNSGYVRSGDLVDIGTRSDSGKRQRGFVYRINDCHAFLWKDEPNGYLSGYWMTPYTMDTVKIAGVDTKNLTVMGGSGTGLGAYENARYRALNMMCELDSVGEWYAEDGVFYAVMPEECRDVYISCKNDGILKITGASDIIFKNISFKNCIGTAVTFSKNPKRCAIIGGSIKNTSGGGVVLGGEDCYLRDADVSYVGGVAIDINGGDEYCLRQGRNYAENNTVTKTGRCMSQRSAVCVRGCGNRASNNHIYDVPTHGIVASGMENMIEKNIIERTNLEMGDTGGIYFENYGMGYGSCVRYNIVKDSVGISPEAGFNNEGALGIYIDDLTSGIEVYGNLVYNAKEPGTFVHSGRYNNIHNNLYINCDTPVRVIKTGINKGIAEGGSTWNNIKKYDLETVGKKYPQAEESLLNLGDPVCNRVVNNVSYGGGSWDFEKTLDEYDGEYSGNVSLMGRPGGSMTDFYDLDYTEIHESCPDFEEIPFEDIGTYCGGCREDSEDCVFDNSCESFELEYPANGAKNVPVNLTLKWEDKGGVKNSVIRISEDADMERAEKYETDGNFIELSLEYGKKYYWRVENKPFLNYPSRMNNGGIYSFETIGAEDGCEALEKSAEFLISLADGAEFPPEAKDELTQKYAAAKELTASSEKAEFMQNMIDAFLAKRRPEAETDTVIFDDYSADAVGEKPFGLFQRSNDPLDIKTAFLPGTDNLCVKFNDGDEFCHYAARYFYPEKDRVEFATRVTPETAEGSFSMSLVKARFHGTRDGVSAGNAARIIFDSDGIIYGDKGKKHPLMSYSGGQSYDVSIVLNVRAGKYSVRINGETLAENITADCGEGDEIGAILYDTSDATVSGRGNHGVFYVDDTIVRVPRKYGKNAALTGLFINGEKAETGDVCEVGIDADTEVRGIFPENAKTKIVRENQKVYITVVSGDFDSVRTYIIK